MERLTGNKTSFGLIKKKRALINHKIIKNKWIQHSFKKF